MKVIVDASFVLDFLLPDEGSPEVTEVFKNKRNVLASSILLPFEIANSLKSAIKSKRIVKNDAEKILEIYSALRIELIEIDIKDIFEISLKEDLSIYDAVYACLAIQKNLPLLTLDKKLAILAKRKS